MYIKMTVRSQVAMETIEHRPSLSMRKSLLGLFTSAKSKSREYEEGAKAKFEAYLSIFSYFV
jgi:hypothetical protein